MIKRLAELVLAVAVGLTAFAALGMHSPIPARADCCDYYDAGDGNLTNNASLTYSFEICDYESNGGSYCYPLSFNATALVGVGYSLVNDADTNQMWEQWNVEQMDLDVADGNAYWYPTTVKPELVDNHYEWNDYSQYRSLENNVSIVNSCPQGCSHSSNDSWVDGNDYPGDAYWDGGIYQTDTASPDDDSACCPESVQWYAINGDIGNQP